MSELKITETNWYPDQQLIITKLTGVVDMQDIMRWEQSLHAAIAEIPDSTTFKIFVNLHGFTAANVDAHKYYRNIIPITLADYGWKVGYLAMFPEEAANLALTTRRNIRCIAAVHCHQDETKISKYQNLYSSDREHFYTDPEMAQRWICNWLAYSAL